MARSDDRLPAELADVADALQEGRPRLTPLELDQIKRRAMTRGARMHTTTTRRGMLMRSRFALTAMLALGLVMSGGGATLAVTGLTSTDSAGIAQYGQPQQQGQQPTQQGGQVLGDVQAGEQQQPAGEGGQVLGDAGEAPGAEDQAQVLGEVAEGQAAGGDDAAPADAQPARQLEAGVAGDELPFTGYLGIPILVVGLMLLAGGVVLRRRAGEQL